MRAAVIWSPSAKAELFEHALYIAQDDIGYAIQFVDDIQEQTDRLADFPKLGAALESGKTGGS